MSKITVILGTLTAIEFLYIFYLETIATTSDATGRVFKMTKEELKQKSVNTLFKNQGVYNALIAVLLLISIYILPNRQWLGIVLGYIILVALYGSITSDKMIFIKQGGLAILTILSLCF